MSIDDKYLALWEALNVVMKKNLELAQEYSIMAEDLKLTDSVNSVALRGQAIGLLYANNNLSTTLREQGFFNLE